MAGCRTGTRAFLARIRGCRCQWQDEILVAIHFSDCQSVLNWIRDRADRSYDVSFGRSGRYGVSGGVADHQR